MQPRARKTGRPVVIGAVMALAVAAAAHTTTYTVRPGDTLSEIAADHGVSTAALAEANGLRDANRVVAGRTLSIPGSTAGPTSHLVQRGETLRSIARRYGVTVAELARANGMPDPNRLRAGTRLRIGGGPAAGAGSPARHVVQPGETLAAIAARNQITVGALARFNRIADPNRIHAGGTLTIPGFVCPVAGEPWFQNDWGAPRPGGRRHQGNDLFAPRGTAVVAPVAGRAEHVRGPVGGLQVVLHGDDGRIHIGTHMESFGAAGRVPAGAVLGRVGTSGNAEGTQPHLHFEILVGGGPANPYPALQASCRR